MELREFASIDENLLGQIGRLRIEAWQTETANAADMETWVDEFDRAARHWVVFQNARPVAAARLSIHASLETVPDAESYAGVFAEPPPGPIASLNRLVVHPATRGCGLSKKLDLIRLEAAEKSGCRSAILSTASGPRRIAQLLGCGFVLIGYGPRFRKPPLCHLPPPAVLLHRLPHHDPSVRISVEDSTLAPGRSSTHGGGVFRSANDIHCP
jgi:GNAT superfamily N-acetyltransferase